MLIGGFSGFGASSSGCLTRSYHGRGDAGGRSSASDRGSDLPLAVLDKHFVLTGMMASGKTTVGRALARRLSRDFMDLDSQIELESGRSISSIFAEDGETYFRDLEHEVLRGLLRDLGSSGLNPAVISLGGGAFVFDRNRELFQMGCVSIFLNASYDILASRLASNSSNRPLASNLRSLLEERMPRYEKADIEIEITASREISEIVSGVIHVMMQKYGSD